MKRTVLFSFFIIPAVFLLIQGPCWAWGSRGGKAALSAGEKAYWTKDYSTALAKFKKAADAGNKAAQWWLSVMYAEGAGVGKDEAEAVKWIKLSAEKGFAPAQVSMGMRYLTGNQVERDEPKAVEWFQKAAGQGNGTALIYLAFMYARGEGVKEDTSQALKYFRLAKDKGFPVKEELLTEEGISKIEPRQKK
ncbi:tetratricopeptide repeat protein [Thermodesulfobacteriota bacterium]